MARMGRKGAEPVLAARVFAFAVCVPLITRLPLSRQEAILEPRRPATYARAREEWLVSHLLRHNEGPLSDEGLRELFTTLIAVVKREVTGGRSAV